MQDRCRYAACVLHCLVICTGSPLGLFLALRKVDPSKGRGLGTQAAAGLMLGAQASQPGCGDGLPAVHRMYNLYHPFDPVGYRWVISMGSPCRHLYLHDSHNPRALCPFPGIKAQTDVVLGNERSTHFPPRTHLGSGCAVR